MGVLLTTVALTLIAQLASKAVPGAMVQVHYWHHFRLALGLERSEYVIRMLPNGELHQFTCPRWPNFFRQRLRDSLTSASDGLPPEYACGGLEARITLIAWTSADRFSVAMSRS